MIILTDPDDELDIPADVAVCPICSEKLIVWCNAWEESEIDGKTLWRASDFYVTCESEPGLDPDGGERELWKWRFRHFEKEDVWTPVKKKILRWLDDNYRFEIDPSFLSSMG